MRISKPLRWILYILGGLIAGLLLIIILLAIIRIPIDLSRYKGPVESAASLALGRRVTVDDKIVITTSLRPIFSLEGLLTPDIILIDTTKIRICGKGQVDFKKETIDLKMAPTPKRPTLWVLSSLSMMSELHRSIQS